MPGRDTRDEDALQLDRYIDELLAGQRVPVAVKEEPTLALDPTLAHAALAVSSALSRFHPSFRFEERLADRLRDGEEQETLTGERPAASGVVIPFQPTGGPSRLRSRRLNGALIGGAISAGVSLASLAGAALVARRRGRSDGRWERVV